MKTATERPKYECAVCHMAVAIIEDHPPIRGCVHTDSPILANAVAQAHGAGGMAAR